MCISWPQTSKGSKRCLVGHGCMRQPPTEELSPEKRKPSTPVNIYMQHLLTNTIKLGT